MSANSPIVLSVAADPALARLVRMSATNVAMLSSMSVERIEDIRMAAEEAFIYACATDPGSMIDIEFAYDADGVAMTFELGDVAFPASSEDDPTSAYVDLILGAVCDSYVKSEHPGVLELVLKADV